MLIAPEVIAALQCGGDKESGWLLMGTNDDCLTVEAAVAAGKGNLSSVAVDSTMVLAEVRRLAQMGLAIVGFAHSHPTGHSEPSVFDFRGDSRWVAELPRQAGAFGIVARGAVRWFYLASGDRWYRKWPD